MQYKLLKYLLCIWGIVHQIKTLTFNRSHFLSRRNSMLAFLPIICYCSVRDNNIKNYWQNEVSYTEDKCCASALQSWFLWINHSSSVRKWCYTDLGVDSHQLPACPYSFLWELLTNSVTTNRSLHVAVEFLNRCYIQACFIMDSTFLQEFL